MARPRGQSPRAPLPPQTAWARLQRIARDLAVLVAILGGFAVIGGGVIFISIAELRSFALGTVGVGAILLLLALASTFVQVRRALVGRRGRYSANAIVIVITFTAITILVSLISFLNPTRLDVTATKQFTLAPQTLKVLADLKEPVKATAFFVPDLSREAADRQRSDDFLFEFGRRSNGKFTYVFVDPEAEPAKPRQMGISDFPSIVFESQTSTRRQVVKVPPVTEQDFASALITVTDPARQKAVYFLTGHGEKDIADTAENSFAFGLASRGIVGDNYQIRTVNLFKDKAMPNDVAVLVVAGPQRDMLTDEVPVLTDWLEKGGRAVFLLDPDAPKSFKQVLMKWGVRVLPGTIVDEGSSVSGDPRTILVQRAQYPPAEITAPLDATFFPLAAALDIPDEYKKDPRKQPPWVTYSPLIPSSLRSWVTEDASRNTFREEKDVSGPAALGLIVTAFSTLDKEPSPPAEGTAPTPTRLVLIGDSDFASNKYFHAYSNGDLLVNSVNWLAQDFSLISIRPKPTVFRQLVLTRSQFDFIRYASWFFLPGLIALGGIFAWWQRR